MFIKNNTSIKRERALGATIPPKRRIECERSKLLNVSTKRARLNRETNDLGKNDIGWERRKEYLDGEGRERKV